MKPKKIQQIIKDIFSDIDNAIESCICASPSVWNESQFRKKYKIIKEEWLGEKNVK